MTNASVRTTSLDPSRDYSGPKCHSFKNGFTLANTANSGSQASVSNRAICRHAKLGVTFTPGDVVSWQEPGGRSLETMPAHLESLVGKGFLVAVGSRYRLVSRNATGDAT